MQYYFKHYSNEKDKVGRIIRNFGLIGYGAFMLLKELLLEKGTVEYDKNLLCRELYLEKDVLRKFIEFCNEERFIDIRNDYISIKEINTERNKQRNKSDIRRKAVNCRWKKDGKITDMPIKKNRKILVF
jgi:hypothetical protein